MLIVKRRKSEKVLRKNHNATQCMQRSRLRNEKLGVILTSIIEI